MHVLKKKILAKVNSEQLFYCKKNYHEEECYQSSQNNHKNQIKQFNEIKVLAFISLGNWVHGGSMQSTMLTCDCCYLHTTKLERGPIL